MSVVTALIAAVRTLEKSRVADTPISLCGGSSMMILGAPIHFNTLRMLSGFSFNAQTAAKHSMHVY